MGVEVRTAKRQTLRDVAPLPEGICATTGSAPAKAPARSMLQEVQRRRVKDRLSTRFLEEVDKSAGRIRLASTIMEITNLPALGPRLPTGKVNGG